MFKRIWYVMIFIIVATVFVSCAMIPAPRGEDDTLLIIRIEQNRETDEPPFGSYYLEVQDGSGKRVRDIELSNSSFSQVISRIPPGQYRIARRWFVYHNTETRVSEFDINIPFELFPGTVTVLEPKAIITFGKHSDHSTSYYTSLSFKTLPLSEKREVLSRFEGQKGFSSWRKPQWYEFE